MLFRSMRILPNGMASYHVWDRVRCIWRPVVTTLKVWAATPHATGVLVCVGVWVLRVKNPSLERPFKTPLVPFVPIMGMIVCSSMIISLDRLTQLSALGWMVIGLVVYFGYSRRHSLLGKGTH